MKKIVAFAGSNSITSINHQLISYVASQCKHHETKVIKLTDYPLPIFGEDLEKEGFPENLVKLHAMLKEADGLIISVNEHNGTLSSFFKNTLDWLTRIELKLPEGKKVFLLSTSPGKRGGQTALEYISGFLPRIGADVVASIPFPSFGENFSVEKQEVLDSNLSEELNKAISLFQESL